MIIHFPVGINDDEGVGPVRYVKRLQGHPGAEGPAQIRRARLLPRAGPDQAPLPLDQFDEQLVSNRSGGSRSGGSRSTGDWFERNGDEACRTRLAEGDFTHRPFEGPGEPFHDLLLDATLPVGKDRFVGVIEQMHLAADVPMAMTPLPGWAPAERIESPARKSRVDSVTSPPSVKSET